jgi:8-oxo-dGTP pyrophosphatase MutT (NUDIX family)
MKSLIEQLLREELTKPDKFAVGVLIKCTETGRVFLLLRNDKVPVWSVMSGGLDKGETQMECLKREMREELKVDPELVTYKYIHKEYNEADNLEFYYYEGLTKKEFIPKLDHENLKGEWFAKDEIPSPLFKGMKEKIAQI